MRNLTIDEINATSGGTAYFCTIVSDKTIVCNQVVAMGEKEDLAGNIQFVSIINVEGYPVFFID